MRTNDEAFQRSMRYGVIRQTLADELGPLLTTNPEAAEGLASFFDKLEARSEAADERLPIPADDGLSQLVGLGPGAAPKLAGARQPAPIAEYDDEVSAERIQAVADLYYIYQHERLGLFQAVLALQQLFNAGAVRLSNGPGAFALYRFDRRQVLRYTELERKQAYRRVFGYTGATPAPGAQPNGSFHPLFVQFVGGVAEYYRDKRVSEVIRPRATDPSFGSIAVVRRAGLDLRNNLEHASYGHVNVLRVDALQLLDEAFRILGSEDVRNLFGADNAWDALEEIMRRYLNRPQIAASQRNRMAETGRNILNWLSQPFIRSTTRTSFEAALIQIGDDAEEWTTSAEALGIAAASGRTLARGGAGRSGIARLPAPRRQPLRTARRLPVDGRVAAAFG